MPSKPMLILKSISLYKSALYVGQTPTLLNRTFLEPLPDHLDNSIVLKWQTKNNNMDCNPSPVAPEVQGQSASD